MNEADGSPRTQKLNDSPDSIDTVVFDLGNVVVRWDPRNLYRKLFSDQNDMEHFLTHVCNLEWNEKQDKGRSFAEGLSELIAKHPKYRTYIEAYHARWSEMLGGEIPETVSAIRDLKRLGCHRVFALSNWSAETFPIAQKMYPVLNEFDEILLSGREKMVKPDPAFYLLLRTRHAVDPKRAVFIDDMERNIDAAKKLGFHAVHFRDPRQLAIQLQDLGVWRHI